MEYLKLVLLSAVMSLVAACSNEPDTLLFIDAVDYAALEPDGGCLSDPVDAIYHSCIDNETLYNEALSFAKAQGTPLMIIWGFNECPFCKVFDGQNFNPNNPWKTSKFIKALTPDQRAGMSAEQLKNFQISIVRLHSRTPNGLAFADKLGVTALARERGWHRVWSPFIMVADPATGQIHTEEQWNAQWSFCESSSEFIVNLVEIGALPSDNGHAWPMCPSP